MASSSLAVLFSPPPLLLIDGPDSQESSLPTAHSSGLHWHVRAAQFRNCSPAQVMPFLTKLKCLVELEIIKWENTTPADMYDLLADLPHLHRLYIHNLNIKPNSAFVKGGCTIPFFEGANEMTLLLKDYSPENLSWIPPYAKFSKLSIGTKCVVQNSKRQLVNDWIDSSRETLKRLSLDFDCDGMCLGVVLQHDSQSPLLTLQLFPFRLRFRVSGSLEMPIPTYFRISGKIRPRDFPPGQVFQAFQPRSGFKREWLFLECTKGAAVPFG